MKNILKRLIQTFSFVCAVNIFWIIIFYIARGIIYLLDFTRGLDSDFIQGLFIELFVPGFAMYISLELGKSIFLKSWYKVGILFSILLFFILYFFFGDFIKPIYKIEDFSIFFSVGFVISILIGGLASFFYRVPSS